MPKLKSDADERQDGISDSDIKPGYSSSRENDEESTQRGRPICWSNRKQTTGTVGCSRDLMSSGSDSEQNDEEGNDEEEIMDWNDGDSSGGDDDSDEDFEGNEVKGTKSERM